MFLKRAGIDSEIFEARERPDHEEGAFLNLMPNGMDVLKTLGIRDEVAGGRRAFFGYTATPAGAVYWFSNHSARREPVGDELARIPDAAWRGVLLELHRDDPDPVPRIIRSTAGRIGRWAIYDLPSLERWHRGRVCLIGDAAHATSPHVGGGASLAMEDAVVLAKCVRDTVDVEPAFARFQEQRKARVDRLVREARPTGRPKAVSNPVLIRLRDLLLPVFLKRATGSSEWIHSYHVDWGSPDAASRVELTA